MAADGPATPEAETQYPADRLSERTGRAAGWILYSSLLAFDVIFVLGALSEPTWWRWAMFVVIVVSQVAFCRFASLPPRRR